MKTTFFVTLISLLLLASCSSLNSSKKIRTFEQTLGKSNSKALTEYVNAVENEILKKKYPSLTIDKAYLRLLSEDYSYFENMELHKLFTDYNLEKYFKSQLWNEIYAPVDSVWIDKSTFGVRFVYLSEEGKKLVGETGGSLKKTMDQDSIIKSELSGCYFNRQGKYWQAIESIENGIPFLEELYKTKNEVGEISRCIFESMVKRHKLDLNDYLTRRIIAVELGKSINYAREPDKNTFANKA